MNGREGIVFRRKAAANKAVKLSVRPVTRVAKSATRAPARPAAYGRRSTDEDDADSCNQDER